MQELLERYSGVALEKQLAMTDSIANVEWNVDMRAGTATFGKDLTFPIQMLGSVSHQSHTWLWAWANSQAQISSDSLTQAYLKDKGFRVFETIDSLTGVSAKFTITAHFDELNRMTNLETSVGH